ncbi:MAG: hypothetical protein ACRDZ4_02765 [Egibacteraceae bacterium]
MLTGFNPYLAGGRCNPFWLPVVVLCDPPRCQRLWTVEFPVVPAGQERMGIWRLVMCRRG